jgi:hypothetical protein
MEFYSFFNLGAGWDGWSKPRMTRFPLCRRLGGPLGRSFAENLALTGFDPRTLQHVARRYSGQEIKKLNKINEQ